jgi:hypothetical protein
MKEARGRAHPRRWHLAEGNRRRRLEPKVAGAAGGVGEQRVIRAELVVATAGSENGRSGLSVWRNPQRLDGEDSTSEA